MTNSKSSLLRMNPRFLNRPFVNFSLSNASTCSSAGSSTSVPSLSINNILFCFILLLNVIFKISFFLLLCLNRTVHVIDREQHCHFHILSYKCGDGEYEEQQYTEVWRQSRRVALHHKVGRIHDQYHHSCDDTGDKQYGEDKSPVSESHLISFCDDVPRVHLVTHAVFHNQIIERHIQDDANHEHEKQHDHILVHIRVGQTVTSGHLRIKEIGGDNRHDEQQLPYYGLQHPDTVMQDVL